MKEYNIYKNKKVLSNNMETYYGENNKEEIEDKFNNDDIVFNKQVIITTKDKIYNTKIVSKYNDHIITSSRDYILLKDIISIKK